MRLLLAAALLLCGCKKTQKPRDLDLERVSDLRNGACSCNDRACAEKVVEQFEKAGGLPKSPHAGISEAHRAAMTCIAQFHTPPVPAPPMPPDAAVANVPEVPPQPDAALLIAAARAWQQANEPRMGIAEINVMYVEANGMLDAEHGALSVVLGVLHQPADDLKRKTGAPIPEAFRPKTCPTLTFSASAWQRSDSTYCREAPTSMTKCNVVDIWKQALASKYQKVPPEALAVLKYQTSSRPTWSFSIEDKPRNIDIDRYFDDTCEMAVEKSPK